MSNGPALRQLQQALRDLGYDPDHTMAIGNHFTWATAAAINRFLAAHGARTPATVTTGLFDDVSGTVEISGPGIADGTRVEVPAS